MSATTVFVECVSCGVDLELFDREVADGEAAQEARRRGWSVIGFYGAKATRCRRCRRARRRDRDALDAGLLGRLSGYQTSGRHVTGHRRGR